MKFQSNINMPIQILCYKFNFHRTIIEFFCHNLKQIQVNVIHIWPSKALNIWSLDFVNIHLFKKKSQHYGIH